jgi:hypothetical protein
MHHFIFAFLVSSWFFSATRSHGEELKITVDGSGDKIHTGVYSLYDTSRLVDGRRSCDVYRYISPIIFLKDSVHFIQDAHSVGSSDSILIRVVKSRSDRFDTGRYYINNGRVTLNGMFTFFAQGYDWRYYPASYEGYFSPDMDTLFLRIASPFPRIKKKFNKKTVEQIQSRGYDVYVYKKLTIPL